MAHEITVPRLGWSMEEGVFGEWLKTNGDYVEAGEMVFLLEGEKAAHEIESLEAGYLHIPDHSPRPGDTVKVGQVIGFLLGKGESPPKGSSRQGSSPQEPAQRADEPVSVSTQAAPAATAVFVKKTTVPPIAVPSAPRVAGPAARRLARELGIDLQSVPTPDPTGRVLTDDVRRGLASPSSRAPTALEAVATPRARRRARELGIDWNGLRGTGRSGRIRERDVVAHASTKSSKPSSPDAFAPASPGRHVPASKLRMALAQRMLAGVVQAAPVTLSTKVDAEPLVAYRNALKSQAQGAKVPSFNDMLIWLAARTLRDRPELNACWYRDGVYHYDGVHIATAVDTEAGLLAPVIRDADRLTLTQIAEEATQRIAAVRSGSLNQSLLQGGTFSITNLGTLGIDAFTPVLNLPQAGILGVGRIAEEPVVRDGCVVPGHTLTLSLTFDHRVVDGAPAARWLQRLTELIHSLRIDA
jgi:pyruvate dehydrogenase E2 component (dihydrolipoamide acetyltransferase)